THNRFSLFGQITDAEMHLNDAGRMVERCWNEIPVHFPHVELDAFVVMPNHVHGIVVIADSPSVGISSVGAKNFSPLHTILPNLRGQPPITPLQARRPQGTSKTIGSIVRGFKIGVTTWMRQNTNVHDVWQRNYWEHIIRNEPELNRIREYIRDNPANWVSDSLYVVN
ncbi:transposase, partial [Chlorobium sp. KB01]|uniref:transposase n=1 Tax=Chlorobium sp. KB01 TaxID=1917528 RepID=UPI000975AAA8